MFAELLATSSFSFLRGASHPEELVRQAKALGLAAIAICDRDGLYGSVRAFNEARSTEQRSITGVELTLSGLTDKRRSTQARRIAALSAPTLALLCETHTGYQNVCRLLTLAHADRPKGESALELGWLEAHAAGLFALIPAPRRPGDPTTPSADYLSAVKTAFGKHAAIVMYRHHDGFDDARLAWVLEAAKNYGFQVVASARPLFHHPNRKQLCDVLHAIRLGVTLDRAGTLLASNAQAFLRSEKQMLDLFSDHPEWVEAAGALSETLCFQLSELNYQFPCTLEPGESADQKLARLTWAGLSKRYPEGPQVSVREQVEKELTLIAQMQVAPYFLSTWEVVEMARKRRILCQGRGSAANSAVCYAIGITAVDPTRSNLLFERFLSVERRNEPPDIDVDFEHERREEVIQDIYERYGRERAAMVSEVICYRGKSALREVGKAFGLSLEQVERLSGTITHWDTAEVSGQRLLEMGFDARDGRVQQILQLAREMAGFPRHLSIHVGGFVLSAAPLYEVAPVEPAKMVNRTVVPWDKDDLEALGFFKIDVLGLGMLTAIRKALAAIHAEGQLRIAGSESADECFDPIDVMARVPQEDPAVYEMVTHADTVGVFQIESRAQMAMLPRLKPKVFYDLVIEVAIVRPGPIQGGMVHPYLRRRSGEEKPEAPHPSLAPILERTLGVPLFQEQVMQIAIEGAGFSGGEADQLRRDMAAWKKTGKLERHRERLLEGFAKKGIRRQFGLALFEQIKGFGDYGFPESHAASFALLVYTSAWQKAHYPAHFACALLNSQPMGFYSAATIIHDAQRHGVEVRDVDVTRSDWDSTLEPVDSSVSSNGQTKPRALRLGLRQIKGLSAKCAQRLEQARTERPFSSLDDTVRRATLRADELERLAEAGAFETLLPGRRQALWRARAPRVSGLFAGKSWVEPEVHLPELEASESLIFDYRHKSLSVGDHPMRHVRKNLSRAVLSAGQLRMRNKGDLVSVAGVVICRQQPGTASGVVFITLEDESGFANLILWRAVYEKFRLPARHSSILLAHGEVERQVRPDGSNLHPPDTPESPVIHLIVRSLERLDVPGRDIRNASRDFH